MLGVARSRLCSYTLALALGLSALGVGAVHLHVLVAYAVLVIASALLSCRPGAFRLTRRGTQDDRPKQRSRARFSPLQRRIAVGAVVWFCLTLVCWLQVVPLPTHWLERWAPLNADIWSRALRPFGALPAELASISLAPGRSLVEALRAASYGLVFGISARIAGRHGIASIAWIIFGNALLVAAVTAVHQMLGAERLYGVYAPLNSLSVAPILNNNSLAGYLNLGVCCGLGLLFRGRPGPLSPLLGVGLLLVAAEVILCQSRGGVACFSIGLLLIFALQLGRRATTDRWTLARQAVALTLLLAGAAVLAALALRIQDWHRLADESMRKLDLLRWSTQLAQAQSSLGVGRGAFGSVAFMYSGEGRNVAYDHAENVLVQWASEWGVGVTLLALLALGWAFSPLLRRAALIGSPRRCMLVGCFVLLLQNMVDLGLEIPAVAAALACALGGLLGSLQRVDDKPAVEGYGSGLLAPSSRTLLLGSSLTGVALVAALLGGSELLPGLRQDLYAKLRRAEGGRPGPEFWDDLRAATRAFPADPYFPVLGSAAALASGKNALPWITRALERAPRQATTHLLLARILRARGATEQALGALRHSIELDAGQAKPALRLGLAWGLRPEALRDAVPEGASGAQFLRLLAARASEPRTRLSWLEEAVARQPEDADSHYWFAYELLEDLNRGEQAVMCRDRDACAAAIRKHAESGERAGDPRVAILLARLSAALGEAPAAEAALWVACQRFAGNPGCDEALVTLCLSNRSERLPQAIKRFEASGCASQERCGRTHLTLGSLYSGAGQWHVALTHFERAAREAPSALTWKALAEASRRVGNDTLEADALRRVGLLEARPAPARNDDAESAEQAPPPESNPAQP